MEVPRADAISHIDSRPQGVLPSSRHQNALPKPGPEVSEWNGIEALRAEMKKPDAPEEVFALYSDGGFGDDGQRIIRIKNGKGTISYDRPVGQISTRELTNGELQSFRALVSTEHVDDLPSLQNTVADGWWYGYFHLTRHTYRYVYMNNPGFGGSAGTAYDVFVRRFRQLTSTGKFAIHLAGKEQIKGLEILHGDGETEVEQFFKHGNDMRILLKVKATDISTWHAWRNDRVAEEVDPPPGVFPSVVMDEAHSQSNGIAYAHCTPPYLCRAGDDFILAGERGLVAKRGALWRYHPGALPQRLTQGEREFSGPVATADGKWAVVAESTQGWSRPYPLICVNLLDGATTTLKLPTDERYRVENRLADGRILASGEKYVDDKEEKTFWAIDPARASAGQIKGDFGPLSQQSTQRLQRAAEPDCVWAVERDGSGSRVGKWNEKTFAFKTVLNLPQMPLRNENIYVDESAHMAYLVIWGDLLKVPISAE